MEEVRGEIKDGKATIYLSGRIDSNNAPSVEESIGECLKGFDSSEITIDAENLEYISSAGLRLILRLRKTYADLRIIGASTEVYDIFDMTGFRAPDGVVYLADCLSSRETLEKYQIGFVYDVAAYLDTLERVKTMEAPMFVPAHAAATADIAPLAQYNIDKVYEVAERITDLCREPRCFESVLQSLFAAYDLTMNFEQYALVGSTVRSYLAWLKDTGKLTARFENNQLLWARA